MTINIVNYLFFLQIGHDYGYFTMVTDLPKYMTGVLKFDIHSTGYLSALPYAVMWVCSILFGYICDKIVKKNWMTVTNARKTFTTVGKCFDKISSQQCQNE